jgi:hypothetical protein
VVRRRYSKIKTLIICGLCFINVINVMYLFVFIVSISLACNGG